MDQTQERILRAGYQREHGSQDPPSRLSNASTAAFHINSQQRALKVELASRVDNLLELHVNFRIFMKKHL